MSTSAVAVFAATAAARTFEVGCLEGCLPRGDDGTLDLLLRPDAATPLTLQWKAAADPAANGKPLRLYTGNPSLRDAIADRGALAFTETGGVWMATHRIPADDLGTGTLVAVLVDDGDRIRDWRAFRLLTRAEQERRDAVPSPPSAWSVVVRPTALQVTSGRGELPRGSGGDEKVWWGLASQGDTADLDIDGEHTGVPGLSIDVSAPWHAGAGRDWKRAVLDKLTGVPGHTVRFEDLKWIEQPDRTIEGAGVVLRHYYTFVTLHTSASFKTFDAKAVGGGGLFSDPTYFSHETSARLKHTRDLRFWASYDRREYSADPRLLALLQDQARSEAGIPGLADIQQDDGDGGPPTYRVAFQANVRPWEEPGTTARRRAGFVGVDVVAARAGHGAVVSQGSEGQGELQKVLCQVIRCAQNGGALDLDRPPSGYDVASASALLGTLPGQVTMIAGEPRLVQRGGPPNLPERTQFALAAHLRAGALVRKGRWGHAKDLVPINSYAQLVVKLTVAMVPDAMVVTADDPIRPPAKALDIKVPVPKTRGILAWLGERLWMLGASTVLVLVILVPGFRQLLSAVLGRLAGWIQRK